MTFQLILDNLFNLSLYFDFSYCRYQKCLSSGMDPELVMTSDETKEMKEKASRAKNGRVSLTKYRQRIKGLEKNKDVTNTIDLNPEAVQFSDISADAYLNLPSSSTNQPVQNNNPKPSTSTCQALPMQNTDTNINLNFEEILAQEGTSTSQTSDFDGDLILNDLNQGDRKEGETSILVELPHDLESLNENDIIFVLTEESEMLTNTNV